MVLLIQNLKVCLCQHAWLWQLLFTWRLFLKSNILLDLHAGEVLPEPVRPIAPADPLLKQELIVVKRLHVLTAHVAPVRPIVSQRKGSSLNLILHTVVCLLIVHRRVVKISRAVVGVVIPCTVHFSVLHCVLMHLNRLVHIVLMKRRVNHASRVLLSYWDMLSCVVVPGSPAGGLVKVGWRGGQVHLRPSLHTVGGASGKLLESALICGWRVNRWLGMRVKIVLPFGIEVCIGQIVLVVIVVIIKGLVHFWWRICPVQRVVKFIYSVF